jgi:hypothetical protein
LYNQDPCPSVSENAVFRKYAEFQYNFHLRSLIAPRSREESRSTRRDMQSAPVEAAVTALDDGLRLLCAACACLQGGRCALLSAAHRPGPMSSRAVKRTGSCCATPRAGGAARRRSVRQRGGDAQTHDGCVQALLLATGAAAHCPFTVMVRSHLVGQPCKGGHRALASHARPLTILELLSHVCMYVLAGACGCVQRLTTRHVGSSPCHLKHTEQHSLW